MARFRQYTAKKHTDVWLVLDENWGANWWLRDWPLTCPQCGRRDRLSSATPLFGHALACGHCSLRFTARAAALPNIIPIPLWVLAVYLLVHGASVRQLESILALG